MLRFSYTYTLYINKFYNDPIAACHTKENTRVLYIFPVSDKCTALRRLAPAVEATPPGPAIYALATEVRHFFHYIYLKFAEKNEPQHNPTFVISALSEN